MQLQLCTNSEVQLGKHCCVATSSEMELGVLAKVVKQANLGGQQPQLAACTYSNTHHTVWVRFEYS